MGVIIFFFLHDLIIKLVIVDTDRWPRVCVCVCVGGGGGGGVCVCVCVCVCVYVGWWGVPSDRRVCIDM